MSGRLLVLGLTGPAGAGKSSVAESLAERGAVVINADTIGYETLAKPDVRDRLVKAFGPQIFDAGGRVDRKKLADVVFRRQEDRQRLEAIVHPVMVAAFEEHIERARRDAGTAMVVLDAAILYEAGWDRLCDHVIAVNAPQALRAERLGRSRGWNEDELARREASQMPVEAKLSRADVQIVNDGSLASLKEKVTAALSRLTSRQTGSQPLCCRE